MFLAGFFELWRRESSIWGIATVSALKDACMPRYIGKRAISTTRCSGMEGRQKDEPLFNHYNSVGLY